MLLNTDANEATLTTTARVTARGAAYNYAAQVATVMLQFGYAAITSRALTPEAFGAYAAALAISGLVTVIAIAGLPHAISRLNELDSSRMSAFLLYALAVGAVTALFLYFSAPAWAAVVGIPGTAAVLRVLAVSALFTPLFSLATGIMLRLGRFRQLALITFACNVAGMLVGVVAVLALRSPAALVVSSVVGQGAAAIAMLIMRRDLLLARPNTQHLRADLLFSANITGTLVVSYTASNVGKLFLGGGLGATALGRWNRAEVLTTTPFYQLQSSLAQALLPAFRHDDSDPGKARRVWADLFGFIAWVCMPLAAVLAVLLPVVIPVFFGDQWLEVAAFAPVLAISGGLRTVFFILVNALEVLGHIRPLWIGHSVSLAVAIASGALTLAEHSDVPVLIGAIAVPLSMHVVQIVHCARASVLNVPLLLRHYLAVAASSTALAAVVFVAAQLCFAAARPAWGPAAAVALIVIGSVLLWKLRERLPVIRLARKYGIIGR